MAILTQEQLREQQRQRCAIDAIDGCLEASIVMSEVARGARRIVEHPRLARAELQNLAQAKRQIERAEAALRLVAEDAERAQSAGDEDEVERARRLV